MKIQNHDWLGFMALANSKTSLASLLFLLVIAVQSCSQVSPWSALATNDLYQGAIRVSLAHPFDQAKDDYELLIASPLTTAVMGVCEMDQVAISDCHPGAVGMHPSKLIFANAQVKFFRADESALLEDGLVLRFVAYDAAGSLLDARNVKLQRLAGASAAVLSTPQPVITPSASIPVP